MSIRATRADCRFFPQTTHEREPRDADVVANSGVDGFHIEKQAFERILLVQPETTATISATLATRRTGLASAREGLDARAREQRQATEQRQILQRIQSFFGLERK